MIDEFADPEHGGFFFTGQSSRGADRASEGLLRQRHALGQCHGGHGLLRLAALTGRDDLSQAGRSALESVQVMLERQPAAGGQSLIALDFLLGSTREFAVIAGPDAAEFRAVLEVIATPFLPHKVVAPATPAQAQGLSGKIPLLADRPSRDGRTTTYICENFACQAPVVGVSGVESALPNRGS